MRDHFPKSGVNRRNVFGAACVLCFVIATAHWGCGGSAGGKRDGESAGETIYVEGKVSLRGSQPFPLLLLEARDGRLYMIDASPKAEELKRLQDMAVGVTARVLPDVRGDAPALAIEAYELLALPTGERPVVGIVVGASPDHVTMRVDDGSVWLIEGEFKTVFLGLEGAKIWVVGDRRFAVNTGGGDIRSIHVTEYGIIMEPR